MKLLLHLLIVGALFVFTVEARGKRTTTPPVGEAEPDVDEDEIAPELDEEEPAPPKAPKAPKFPKAPKPLAEVPNDGSVDTCPMKELTASQLKDVEKARRSTCYDLLKAINKKADNNERPTEKQKEMKEVCMEHYTERYLEKKCGGRWNSFKRGFNKILYKLNLKVKKIPCAKDDKILEYAVGLANGKYEKN